MKSLPEILEREQEEITVAFFRATLNLDVVISYPEGSEFEDVMIPKGTEGWYRPTTKAWGTFIFDSVENTTRIPVYEPDLDISNEFEQTRYVLPSYYWRNTADEGVA